MFGTFMLHAHVVHLGLFFSRHLQLNYSLNFLPYCLPLLLLAVHDSTDSSLILSSSSLLQGHLALGPASTYLSPRPLTPSLPKGSLIIQALSEKREAAADSVEVKV